jgi:outer membrane receptor protein involved in Fe transport
MRKLIVTLFAAVLAFSLTAAAQVETGRIVGVVTDPTGAVIPNATVAVKSVTTGAERTGTTDDKGGYTFANLLPGVWELTVDAPGFAKWTRRVQVTVGSKVVLDPQLSVGAAVQVIEVAAEGGVAVNVSQQVIENVIDSKKIVDLPTFNRDPYALVATAANVSTAGVAGRGAGVAINGLRDASTNILLDGASNNDEFVAAVGQSIPLDSVQEFSVITNNFSAEYGRAAAGVVNVATKSGSNEYHGSAFWYGRYSALSSNSWQDNAQGVPRAVFTRNQFGYTIGGPVTPALKDKLFFFNSTEWTRIRSAANRQRTIVRPEFLALTNSATQTFYNTFGARKPNLTIIDSPSRQLLVQEQNPGVTPMPGMAGDPCGASTGSFFTACNNAISFTLPIFDRVSYNVPNDAGGGDPRNEYQIVGRVDYNWNAKTTVYTRYALQRQTGLAGTVSHSPFQGFDTPFTNFNNNILTSLLRSWTSRLTTQTKIVYNRLNNQQPLTADASPTLYWKEGTAQVIGGRSAQHPGFLGTSPGSGIPFGGPQNFAQFYQDASYAKGSHQWRFGGSYVYIQDNRTFGAYQTPTAALSTNNLPQAMVNFLNGQLFRYTSAIDPQGKFPCRDVNNDGYRNPGSIASPGPDLDGTCILTLPVVQPNFSRSNRYHEFALYLQDSIKLARTFTLNLGVRWEYFGVQHNKDPRLDSNFYDGVTGSKFLSIANGSMFITPDSPIHGLWRKDFNNFGPRLGFGWDVFGNGKTSLRGGWGISYERNFGNVTFNVIQNQPNYATVQITNGVDIPSLPIPIDVAGPLAGSSGQQILPATSIRNVDSNIQTAYAQFWSLTVEHEVFPKITVGVDYNGSKGHGLYSLENPNRIGSGNVHLGKRFNAGGPAISGVPGANGTLCTPNGFSCTARINTQFGSINRRSQNAFSNHNAMSIRVTMNNPWSSGLTMTANYTWGHTFDNLSSTFSETGNQFNLGLLDPFNPKLDYGAADFDLRHRMVISAIWDIPFAKNTTGALNRILHGWTIAPIWTARGGTPFSVYDCSLAFFEVCPRMIATAPFERRGSRGTSSGVGEFEYIDLTNTFGTYAHPITGNGEFGPYPSNMVSRNFFRGPNFWNVDLGIYKTTKVTERFSVQLRAEMFNMFNHANDGVIGFDADVSSFNTIRVQPNGRRNVQFTLKILF